MAALDRRPAEPARRWPRPWWRRLRSPGRGRAFVVKSLTPDRAARRVSSHPPNVSAGRLIRPGGRQANRVRVRLRAPFSIQLAAEACKADGNSWPSEAPRKLMGNGHLGDRGTIAPEAIAAFAISTPLAATRRPARWPMRF